ncbi:hypothetical protein [Rhizobium sp. RAF56]|uniref:hypothetical protein n=1 Tax=Rhizobium sp. RAF56 TaxID=3233062 RepID=UPI003F961737
MNPSEYGIADGEETNNGARPTMPRLVASLVVAFFAYLGLAIGGGFGAAATAETNSFSAGKGTQPLYLSLRDTARGVLASSERDLEPKGAWHDGNDALVPTPTSLILPYTALPTGDALKPLAAELPAPGAYLARGPPVRA